MAMSLAFVVALLRRRIAIQAITLFPRWLDYIIARVGHVIFREGFLPTPCQGLVVGRFPQIGGTSLLIAQSPILFKPSRLPSQATLWRLGL